MWLKTGLSRQKLLTNNSISLYKIYKHWDFVCTCACVSGYNTETIMSSFGTKFSRNDNFLRGTWRHFGTYLGHKTWCRWHQIVSPLPTPPVSPEPVSGDCHSPPPSRRCIAPGSVGEYTCPWGTKNNNFYYHYDYKNIIFPLINRIRLKFIVLRLS